MLHACVQKFDVTGNLKKIWEVNRALKSLGLKVAQAHKFGKRLTIFRDAMQQKTNMCSANRAARFLAVSKWARDQPLALQFVTHVMQMLLLNQRITSSQPVDSEPERKGNLNVRAITWVAGGEGGGAGEVAGGALGLVVLVVAVGGPGAVRGDVVGVVAPAALQDGRAVRVVAAREVDHLLLRRRRLVRPAHAELCHGQGMDRTRASGEDNEDRRGILLGLGDMIHGATKKAFSVLVS